MSTRAAAGILAALLFVAGLLVGLIPHHVSVSGTDSVTCGSAFAPDTGEADGASFGSDLSAIYEGNGMDAGTDYVAQCREAVSTPRIFAIVLLSVGALAGLFLLLTASQTSKSPRPATVSGEPGAQDAADVREG